ncbi:pyridoxal phosphate-dependent aminotransferase [Carboxylicivirga sp. A043]|uniref:pyridoxal phosphate-dependent aminotransferase n=1 Tax=Carboxylicivirga litoralis TaxID=2816963 RepID=UPI0021CB50BA|nr:pyridoxal phosphate-dependent aminotransferase [Carboxylicivirga sp. A043]MCU4157749.1 pyridoxal phosphate-dependent aminotransferase [Carboxylicivirga sp. A043]
MILLDEKFKAIDAENAPGQEMRQNEINLDSIMLGEKLDGVAVDFSHGDIDAFTPIPETAKVWMESYSKGSSQAYTEYRGLSEIRSKLSENLAEFTGRIIDANRELIITPGTQGALFLALAATVTEGVKVAIVEPDYFANRKLIKFLGGDMVAIPLNYLEEETLNGLDLKILEESFKGGVKVFVFSTPNNPTGHVYSKATVLKIATLAKMYGVTLIVDQLYSRMLYSGESFFHLRSADVQPDNLITIMGPSKTESLSGFRLGVAVGTPEIIDRMERLQAIVSLRAAGYNQGVLRKWFNEPDGWLDNRICEHEAIRDDLLYIFRSAGLKVARPQAGSYLFPQLPQLKVDLTTFVRLLRHQAGVIVTSGTEFAPLCTNSIRLNFSQKHHVATEAVKRIVKMVEIYRL